MVKLLNGAVLSYFAMSFINSSWYWYELPNPGIKAGAVILAIVITAMVDLLT